MSDLQSQILDVRMSRMKSHAKVTSNLHTLGLVIYEYRTTAIAQSLKRWLSSFSVGPSRFKFHPRTTFIILFLRAVMVG